MMERALALSVIVPARNAEEVLPQSLGALCRSDLPRGQWELIVVDDASTDATVSVARCYADLVVELTATLPLGPAYARNRGCRVAAGDVFVFIDADVCVHSDTLRQFARLFAEDPTIGAAFGSYDTSPSAPGLVSQYRNLLHHYYHHRNGGDAETFWAGCGAVRRVVFFDAGMFDEWHFPRQIEDVELGGRIRALGHRIVLCPEIQGTHLKRWTLSSMIRTDLLIRGVPWTRLLMHQGTMTRAASLNLRSIERVKTALASAALPCAALALLTRESGWLLAAAVSLLAVVVGSVDVYAFFRRVRGWRFAVAAVPLHLLYYTVNGASVVVGWLLHHLVGEPRPDPAIEAYAESGLLRDPPVASQPRTGRAS